MTLDISRIRSSYRALEDGYAYLDGAAGTQTPRALSRRSRRPISPGSATREEPFPPATVPDAIVSACREAVADLVGGEPAGVILGPNMTTLTYRLADTISRCWTEGDEVVVSRLDHDANVRPWVQAAARAGAVVRWAEVDPSSGELATGQYDELLSNAPGSSPSQRRAISSAPGPMWPPSPARRTRPARSPTSTACTRLRPPGHVGALGADFYATSAYKWSGPHIGAVVASPALLETLHPDKLAPAPESVPGRFERGTLPFADLAGTVAAVEHLASLDKEASGTRRERLVTSMTAIEAFEGNLFGSLVRGLEAIEGVTTYGKASRRTPPPVSTSPG